MSYQTRYYVRTASRDGHKYRVNLDRRGYTGPAYELDGPADPIIYRLGEGGRKLYHLNESRLEIRVLSQFESGLRETLDPDPRAWRAVLKQDGTEVWKGFITSDKFRSQPYRSNNFVSVTARDGLALLKDTPYQYAVDNSGRRTLLEHLYDQLDEISARTPLHRLMRWYPYRESSPLTEDPLRALGIQLRTWTERQSEGVSTDRHSILKQIAAAFNMEIFQGFGGWHAVQPVELLSGADLTLSDGSRNDTGTQAPVTRDADTWALRRDDRGGQTQHVMVSATYDFEPDPENLLQKGSFEPDDPSAQVPSFDEVLNAWDFVDTVYRERVAGVAWGGVPDSQKDQFADFPPPGSSNKGEVWYATDQDQHYRSPGRDGTAATFNDLPAPENHINEEWYVQDEDQFYRATGDGTSAGSSWTSITDPWNPITLDDVRLSIQRKQDLLGTESPENKYALAVRRHARPADGGPEPVASTETEFVGAGFPMALRVAHSSGFESDAVDDDVFIGDVPRVWVEINDGAYYLVEIYASIDKPLVPGQERAIRIALEQGNFPDEYEEGQVLIPEGAKIPYQNDFQRQYGDILTLTRPFRVGDFTVYVKSQNNAPTDQARLALPIFVPQDWSPATVDGHNDGGIDVFADPGVLLEYVGETYFPRVDVQDITVKLYDGAVFENNYPDGDFGSSFDNIEIAVLLDGEEVQELTYASQSGSEGRNMESPPVSFGDGPQEISRGALTFSGGDTTIKDDKIGWKRGQWSAGESSNDRTLTKHRSRELLRQRTQGTEEHELGFLLREGDDFSPESLVDWTAADGDQLTIWRRAIEWRLRSGRLRIPGYNLYRDAGAGIYTTLSSVQ